MDKIIIYIGYFILLINTFLYFKSYRKNLIAFKIVSYYLLLCLIVQVYSSYLSSLTIRNLFLSHYYFIGQFILLSFFYSKVLRSKKLSSIINIIVFIVSIILIIYYYLYPKDYLKWNVLEIAITSIPLLIYSFIFFIKNIDNLENKKYIYFNSGLFIYLLSSTLLFTLGNIGTRSVKLYIWKFNSILYLVYQILVFVEWYKNIRKIKKK